MIDSPFDIQEPVQRDGYYAVLFLAASPFAPFPAQYLGLFIGDYGWQGALLGFITFYAFSVGFAISALRQPARSTRAWGSVTLMFDLLVGLAFVPVGN